MEKEPNNNKRNKWLALINIPFQMGVIIIFFSYFGAWLDENHPSPKLEYNTIFVMIGVGLALYNVIRQVNDINKTK
jgi:nitrate reductase gamma subunit